MLRNIDKVGYVRLASDLLLLQLAYLLAGYISNRAFVSIDFLIMALMTTTWYFSNKISNSYDEFRTETFAGELLLVVQNVVVQLLVIGQIFFFLNQHAYARTFVLYYILLLLFGFICYRYLTKKLLLNYRQSGGNTKYLIFIGYNDITKQLAEMIAKTPHYGYKVLGVISSSKTPITGLTHLGNLMSFYKNPLAHRIDEVIITTDELNKEMLNSVYLFAEKKGIRTSVVPNYSGFYSNRFQFQLFGNYPLIRLRSEPLQQEHWQLVKRIIDLLFCIFAFTFIFSWLFPIIAILIKLDSPGPVLFKQERWGKNGDRFLCYKFRSMRINMPEVNDKNEFMQASKSDPRITKFGAFLRRSSLDELPQFINVLLGEMSVVGPRPHAHEHNLRTKDKINSYLVRHWIKPGVTGWAQVNGYRGETKTDEEMQNRINFDIWYIENWTFWLDIKIIFITVYNLIRGEKMAY
jgi:putative colanic acid biosynthesis UDP-glucose lipid carrier transferase